LVDRVLPHTVPNQILRFYDGKRRLLAEMAPPDARFGWPKRNGFVQPMVDAELLRGLERFDCVEVLWSSRMESCAERADGVTVDVVGPSGADPARPYASISIAHGIRRFEFMIHANETDEQVERPEFIASMLAPFVPHPDRVDVIRHRVYTHHSRIASAFRKGRMFLAGDAAHLMPVWQGQGYNSGIRDSANLGWKLAAVVTGQAGDGLLDTYDAERRKHARAMIDLSTLVGRVISPTNARVATLRDKVIRAASVVPT